MMTFPFRKSLKNVYCVIMTDSYLEIMMHGKMN